MWHILTRPDLGRRKIPPPSRRKGSQQGIGDRIGPDAGADGCLGDPVGHDSPRPADLPDRFAVILLQGLEQTQVDSQVPWRVALTGLDRLLEF